MDPAAGGDVQERGTRKENDAASIPARRLFRDARRMPKPAHEVVAHPEPALNTTRRAREHYDVVFQTTDGAESRAHRLLVTSRFPGCGTFFARKNKTPNTVGSKAQSHPSQPEGGRQNRPEGRAVTVICVSDLSLEMLEIVIDVAYRVPLSEHVGPHNVREVLKVAETLSIAENRDPFIQVLKEKVVVGSFIGSYQLTVKGKNMVLERTAFRYILRNFYNIGTTSPEFQSLMVEHLQFLDVEFLDDELHVPDVFEGTFRGISKWIAGTHRYAEHISTYFCKSSSVFVYNSTEVDGVGNDPKAKGDRIAAEFLDSVKTVLTLKEIRGNIDFSTFRWLRPRVPKNVLFMFGCWTDHATNDLVTCNCRRLQTGPCQSAHVA